MTGSATLEVEVEFEAGDGARAEMTSIPVVASKVNNDPSIFRSGIGPIAMRVRRSGRLRSGVMSAGVGLEMVAVGVVAPLVLRVTAGEVLLLITLPSSSLCATTTAILTTIYSPDKVG